MCDTHGGPEKIQYLEMNQKRGIEWGMKEHKQQMFLSVLAQNITVSKKFITMLSFILSHLAVYNLAVSTWLKHCVKS